MKSTKAKCGASNPATQKSTPKMMSGGMAMKKKPAMMYGGMAHKRKKSNVDWGSYSFACRQLMSDLAMCWSGRAEHFQLNKRVRARW